MPVSQLILTWSQNDCGPVAVIEGLRTCPKKIRANFLWAVAREEYHGVSDEDGVHTHMILKLIARKRWTAEWRDEFDRWGNYHGIHIQPPLTKRGTALGGIKYVLKHWTGLKFHEGDDGKGLSHEIWGCNEEAVRDAQRLIESLKGITTADKIVNSIRNGITEDQLDDQYGSYMLLHAPRVREFNNREINRKKARAERPPWPLVLDILGNAIPEPSERNRKRHLAFFGPPGCGKSHWIVHGVGEHAYVIKDKRKAELEFAWEAYAGQRVSGVVFSRTAASADWFYVKDYHL